MKNFRISVLFAAVLAVVALAAVGVGVHGNTLSNAHSLAWGPLPPPDDGNFVTVAWGPLPPPDDDGNFVTVAWGPLPPPDDDGNFVA
jgi:hypothetical protein